MEALLFLLDLVVITYLCWRVFKADKANEPKHEQLQWLDYKPDSQPDSKP